MDIKQIVARSFWDGYSGGSLDVMTIFTCACFTAAIAVYICVVYRMVNKNSFYDRAFHLSLFALALITAMVILTIQSNIVISLGMVGALSIVRFRTAIKSPIDLVFLFWSISAGIICGAGFAMIAVIGSLILTIGIVVFALVPIEKESMILVVNSSEYMEDKILNGIVGFSKYKVRARNISESNVNLAIEVKTDKPAELVKAISGLEGVYSVSLVENDGNVTA